MLLFSGTFFNIVRRRTHRQQFPLCGKKIRIKDQVEHIGGRTVRVGDWVDRMPPYRSWMDYGLFDQAIMVYGARRGQFGKTTDPRVNEVLVALLNDEDILIHVDELELPTPVRP